uniref:Integrase, catalytic region, zinc finger, CCHC-type, peptidase aspartic, catalytic n=1 Tax=Tanacetum cinerariifolium TaxID=118510 RepID=A0A6L2L8T9_TANCI|nr:integrase, catalytic region, zinc finger, CCHC-type, peptidase aspartic, catalytic [Tanacetum cinerariifolium]
MYFGEYLGNQRDSHLQKMLRQQKNPSDTIDPDERFHEGYLKKAQQLKPKLYDGRVIEKSDAIVIPNTEEILMLAKEKFSKELPKVSMVNSCLKKLKFHLASFDMVVKERTTATAITEGTWGFEHTKAYFRDDIIPFLKALKELFTSFDQCLIDENNMENVLHENDRLLTQALSVETMNVAVHDNVKSACLNMDVYAHCVTIESELKKDFIKKECYEMLLQKYHTLEKHCISLEVNNQLKKEIFQRNMVSSPESAPTFAELFKINDLKAQAQAKDTVILKLKEKLRSLNSDMNERKVKREVKEIETLNIELDHKEKVLVITALKEQLNKLKGKSVITEAVSLNLIDAELLKVDVAPLVLKLHKNRTAHTDYIMYTQEEAATLREIIESERLLSPLNTSLDYAYSKATSSVINSVSNVNFDLKCASCNGCLFSNNHDACVVAYIKSVNASIKSKSIKTPVKRKVWKPTGNVFKTVRHIWKPTGQTFTLVGNVCPLTRIATPTIVPLREPIPIVNSMDKPVVTLVYSRKTKAANKKVPNKMEPNNSWGSSNSNVPSSLLTCRLSKSSSGQFCDSDLEVAFRQHTCFIRTLDGVDLLTGSRGNNLYTMSLQDMMASSSICLLSKASKTKSWLWHPCAMGKSTKKTHKPKSEDTNQEKLYLLHMDLCGPMRVESVNRKKYILVIVDDYSRFTWVKFLRSKDETSDFIIKFLKMIQVRLMVPVRRIRTDNGTEFVNKTLRDYYEEVGISHETSVARSPQQNGVVERRNRTLIEAARTMLIYAQAPLFLWAEAVANACFTQNRSIILLRHGKTPYELLHSKIPDLSFFYVFGALCYPKNDSENLGKLQPKADLRIFIGYAPTKKAF